jgi:hypothetical protein
MQNQALAFISTDTVFKGLCQRDFSVFGAFSLSQWERAGVRA